MKVVIETIRGHLGTTNSGALLCEREEYMTEKRTPVVHAEEKQMLIDVLTKMSNLLPAYHRQAGCRFPQAVLETFGELASVGDELRHLFLEGHHPTYREIPWRIAFVVALCANLVHEAVMSCDEASMLLARILYDIGVPSCCAKVALERYTRLSKGEHPEDVDEDILPHTMRSALLDR